MAWIGAPPPPPIRCRLLPLLLVLQLLPPLAALCLRVVIVRPCALCSRPSLLVLGVFVLGVNSSLPLSWLRSLSKLVLLRRLLLPKGRALPAVDALLNDGRDRLDLGAQLLLDAVQVEAVIVGDEVDGKAQVPEAPRAAHPVQVSFRVLGEVKVDHNVDGLDVDASCEQVCSCNAASGSSVLNIVEYSAEP